jgi:hypothetical protein
MNTADSVIADTLDDGQLCLDYRRYFTDEGEKPVTGLLNNDVANGALVFDITDRSGWTAPRGNVLLRHRPGRPRTLGVDVH